MARLSADERQIKSMFAYKRPRGSATEAAFIERFLTPLGFMKDTYGNLHLTVGDPAPPVLFSSHSDTVHRSEGLQDLDYRGGILRLTRQARLTSNCLGADDTAGVWLMTEMVKAGVRGHYIIHYGEESGCLGSSDLANNHEDFLRQFKIAVAFDRAGKADVITYQMGVRCASEDFAKALAASLGEGYAPCSWGAYTDTNEYTRLISECTNISVGYQHQHSPKETQDVPFLISLRDKLLSVDWEALPTVREPGSFEWPDDDLDSSFGGRDWRGRWRQQDRMIDLCKEYPEVVADILEQHGVDIKSVRDAVAFYYGENTDEGGRAA